MQKQKKAEKKVIKERIQLAKQAGDNKTAEQLQNELIAVKLKWKENKKNKKAEFKQRMSAWRNARWGNQCQNESSEVKYTTAQVDP